MNKKDYELASAMVVVSAVSLGVIAFVFGLYGIFWGSSLLFMEMFSEMWGAISVLFYAYIIVIILGVLALKICTLVFAVKGRRENSRKYILVSAILSTISGACGDFLGIAAAVCGYILYTRMNGEDNPHNLYQGENPNGDSIYGM